MPSTGPIAATGEGRYQPIGAPFNNPIDITSTLALPTIASVFSTTSPFKVAHAGWWALGIGIGGFYGATVDQVQANMWGFLDFDQEDFPLPPNNYPDTLFWKIYNGNSVSFEVFW